MLHREASTGADLEPIYDVAHLGHFEVFTPKLDQSLRFFTQILGMTEVDRTGQSVYLRAWGDYEPSTLKLTEAKSAGLGHIGWRATSPAALQRRVQELQARGAGLDWLDGDLGHGPAFRFCDPDGHLMELYYESERYVAPEPLRSKLLNQPQKYVDRGIGVKRIDHVNLMCQEVEPNRRFLQEALGFRLRERLILDEDYETGAWLSVTPLPHDIALTRDRTGSRGRLHHIAYWLDNREDLLRAADILTENNIFIEAGPSKHNISQAFYIYMYEPGGNRVELFSGGYLIFAPDWAPVTWNKEQRGRGVFWGGTLPASFYSYGTPFVELPNASPEHEPVIALT